MTLDAAEPNGDRSPTSQAQDNAVEPLPPGPTARSLAPMPGRLLDPPDIDPPIIAWMVARWRWAAWWWRWWERFRDGRCTLSAKGIAFYSFFGVLSGLVLAFTVAAGVPRYEDFLNEVLRQALPGIVDPDALAVTLVATYRPLGAISTVVLLYSAVSIVRAIDDGIRLAYGVQYEPRSFVPKNLRFLGYLLLLAPLVGLSYAGSTIVTGEIRPALETLGISGPLAYAMVVGLGITVSVGLNTLIIYILLSRMGGVQAQRWRLRASLVGGVGLEAIKVGTAYFVAFIAENPRYLSFGAPVAMLLLFFAMAVVVLASASLVATANEVDPVGTARRTQEPAQR